MSPYFYRKVTLKISIPPPREGYVGEDGDGGCGSKQVCLSYQRIGWSVYVN